LQHAATERIGTTWNESEDIEGDQNMGQSTNAVLAYGYDLGGEEGEWKFAEYDKDTYELRLSWFDDSNDTGEDDEAGGFIEQAEARLLAEVGGFTETDWQAEGYFARQREAEARVGVEFESYCSGDCPMYVLAAHVITVHRGDSKLIDPAELLAQPETEGWDAKLAAAVEALGITPTQGKPGWVLVSYWG
jgi:hypothetical protein